MTIKANLFDSNFPGSPSSVVGKTPKHIEYVREQMEWDGATIFTDEWINSPVVDQVESRYKIGWLHEPYCLHPQTYEHALENVGKFNVIMTYYQPFLDMGESFELVPYAGVWIPKTEWVWTNYKRKRLSMLYGAKMSTDGHRIRHEIAGKLVKAGVDVDFYGFSGTPVNYSWHTKYKTLAPYMFTIVTETCREDNLFTEWLLDCFAMNTIPIFWGCPNLKEWFDNKGVLSFETADQAVEIAKTVTREMYADLTYPMELNKELCASYEVTEDWIYTNVLRGRFD